MGSNGSNAMSSTKTAAFIPFAVYTVPLHYVNGTNIADKE